MRNVLLSAGHALAWVAASYAVLTALAIAWMRRRPQQAPLQAPRAVSVLKPLHGEEIGLYAQLRSFCAQQYPHFQLVFGVHDPCDPALRVVEQLRREFPQLEMSVVADARRHGSNHKVGNLINMLPAARHDWLVIADADVHVPPDYLARVAAPLADARCGLVTCSYRALPGPGPYSLLGSLFIDDWFMPQVLLAALFGARAFVSGATMALRRDVLERIGGLGVLADQLADDYRLGERVRGLGLRIVLSELQVGTGVYEASFGALCRHLLRWLCTVRAVAARGFACSFLTFSLPLALLGGALSGWDARWRWLAVVTLSARLVVHFAAYSRGAARAGLRFVLLPLHELLLPVLWALSLRRQTLSWREQRYHLAADGSLLESPSHVADATSHRGA